MKTKTISKKEFVKFVMENSKQKVREGIQYLAHQNSETLFDTILAIINTYGDLDATDYFEKTEK
jgi:hypothetical protein